MSFEQILEEFHRLSESRSRVLKTIRDCENEITSITERLEELKCFPKEAQKTQDFRDQMLKAKDKRKRIRQEVAEYEHEVRMYDTKIATLKMKLSRA